MSDKPEPKQSKKDRERSANSSSRAGNSSPTQENQDVEYHHPSAAKSSTKNSRVVINPTIIK